MSAHKDDEDLFGDPLVQAIIKQQERDLAYTEESIRLIDEARAEAVRERFAEYMEARFRQVFETMWNVGADFKYSEEESDWGGTIRFMTLTWYDEDLDRFLNP